MAKRARKNQKTRLAQQELVTVTLAEDLEQAREYERLLKDNNIPAAINDENGANVPVVVPVEYLEDAQIVIDSLSAFDDLGELDFAEEYDSGYDEDYLEDEY